MEEIEIYLNQSSKNNNEINNIYIKLVELYEQYDQKKLVKLREKYIGF